MDRFEIANNSKLAREAAKAVLKKAKARERKLLAGGARYERVDSKTIKLVSGEITKSARDDSGSFGADGDLADGHHPGAGHSMSSDDHHGAHAEHTPQRDGRVQDL